MELILIVILILLLIGAVPAWPHASGWGYGPAGIITIVLIALLIFVLLGKI